MANQGRAEQFKTSIVMYVPSINLTKWHAEAYPRITHNNVRQIVLGSGKEKDGSNVRTFREDSE